MKRSVGWFLVFFTIVVVTAVSLILVLPASLGSDALIQAWIPATLGALFAASAYVAWLVRPNWKRLSSQSLE
ncbi:hypothetical protein [Cryobacterium zhongshanensis]|uniref:Uncharacterized protein n=1 Tax=Cryobacterium zhongshanensis TaxID=2928153 RepID=A0AA41QX77_9MICO|nr:hypothetical protein [Cryobacterium zhongshanensis]MCI4658977.1 hypothetical protein [Cryobacterium zhongshanensis]